MERRLSPGAAAVGDAYFSDTGEIEANDPDTIERQLAACRKNRIAVGDEVPRHIERQRQVQEWEKQTRLLEERIRSGKSAGSLLSIPLYPYQVEGIRFLVSQRRAVLADEMGLGKTAQAIGAAWLLAREGLLNRAFVVCPASLKHQRQKEISRFTGAASCVVSGPPARRHDHRQLRAGVARSGIHPGFR
jgi:SNF2 family DNA or RNA helicase